MSSKEIEDFILKNGITKLAPDPKLRQWHGAELASRYSNSAFARGLAKSIFPEKIDHAQAKISGFESEKLGLRKKWRKNRKRVRKMSKDGSTPKQIKLLKALGMKNPETLNKGQASHIISRSLKLEKDLESQMQQSIMRDKS